MTSLVHNTRIESGGATGIVQGPMKSGTLVIVNISAAIIKGQGFFTLQGISAGGDSERQSGASSGAYLAVSINLAAIGAASKTTVGKISLSLTAPNVRGNETKVIFSASDNTVIFTLLIENGTNTGTRPEVFQIFTGQRKKLVSYATTTGESFTGLVPLLDSYDIPITSPSNISSIGGLGIDFQLANSGSIPAGGFGAGSNGTDFSAAPALFNYAFTSKPTFPQILPVSLLLRR